MEINEKKLKKILNEQKQDFQKHVDKSFEKQRKEYQNYLGVVVEDFTSQVKLIAEQYESIIERLDSYDARFDSHDVRFDSIEEKLDSHEMRLLNIEKNIEIMKVDIAFIKSGLKKKVDYEEFEVLVKRVVILEAKR